MPNKRKKRRRRGGLGRMLRPLSLLLAAAAIVAALTMFFKVETIQVTGASRYQAADIIAASGVEIGDNLVLLDRYRVSQRIYTALPYITDVQPRPKFPSTLEIEVTETRAAAAIQGAGGWWLLSAGGKILEAADGSMAAGYPQITGIYAKDPAVSDPLVLPEDGVITAQRLQELLSVLALQEALPQVDRIDCTSPRELVIHYDGRFRAELFYDADFDFKITCLLSAVDKLEPNQKGILRMTMSDDYEVRFIPDVE